MKTDNINLRIKKEDKEYIQLEASKNDVSVSTYIIQLIRKDQRHKLNSNQ